MPSAMPRNNDSEPSVTISGGRFSLVISTAFSIPARHPNSRAAPTAAGIGHPPSRHRTPSTTAERPIMDPTDKSIPPVIMIGVIASASKPNSTLNRTTSKKFDSVKKFSPIAAKIASSIARASASTHSPLGKQISRHGLRWLSTNDFCMFPRTNEPRTHRNRRQNYPALDRPFPMRTEPQERQRRTDHAQQQQSQQHSGNRAAPSRNRHATDHRRRDHLQFQSDSRIARNLMEAHRVEHRGE